jgi:hypothetical protein
MNLKITKSLLTLIFIFSFAASRAQDYQISFTASGDASTVEAVQVQNLTQSTSLTLSNEGDILHLKDVTTGINQKEQVINGLSVYPNPTTNTN